MWLPGIELFVTWISLRCVSSAVFLLGIVKLTKIQSNDPQDIVIASDQERDTMGTSLGCVPAT